MDEEDRAWLQLMNEKRLVDGLAAVEMENFELLMDRLEKESFFQVLLRLMFDACCVYLTCLYHQEAAVYGESDRL